MAQIQSLGISNVKYHQLDITDGVSIERFAKYIKDTHDGLDVLVNNAAILIQVSWKRFALKLILGKCSLNIKGDDPRTVGQKAAETIHVNFTSTVNISHALFPLLRPHARVVNVASTLGLLTYIKNQELADKLSNPNATEKDVTEVMELYVKYDR